MPFRSFSKLLALLGAAILAGSLLRCDSAPQPPETEQCETVPAEEPLDVPADRWTLLGLNHTGIDDIESIAINPCDPRVLLVGSGFSFSADIPGKLFRSSDGGQTWDTLRAAADS